MTKFNRWAAAPRALVAIAFMMALWGRWIWAADAPNIDALIASLSSSSTPDFKKACQALGRMGPAAAKAVPVLSDIAEGKRKGDRKLAIQALSRIHTPDAMPVLSRIAEGPGQESVQAIVGLRQYGATAIPTLLHLARDTGNSYHAVMALGQIGADALPELGNLKTPRIDSGHLKEAIMMARAQLPNGFEDVWRQATSPQDRSRLFTTYSALHARILPQALDQLSSGDLELRRFASSVAFSCSVTVGNAQIPQEYLEPEQDPELLIRILTEHRAAIEAASRDSNTGIAQNATRLLAMLPAQPKPPEPARQMADGAPAAQPQPGTRVDALIASLMAGPPAAVKQACEQLGAMGPAAAKAVPTLSDIADGKTSNDRLAAVQALADIHTVEAIPSLSRAAMGPQQVSELAIVGLRAVGAPAIPALAKIVHEGTTVPQVNGAVSALGVIGPQALPEIDQLKPTQILRPEFIDHARLLATVQKPNGFADFWHKGSANDRYMAQPYLLRLGAPGLGQILDAMADADRELREYAAMLAEQICQNLGTPRRLKDPLDPEHEPEALRAVIAAHRRALDTASTDGNGVVSSTARQILAWTFGASAPAPTPPSSVAGMPGEKNADLLSPDLARRQRTYYALMSDARSRRVVLRTASGVRDPATAEWFRKNATPQLIPEAIEALGGTDSTLYPFATFIVSAHFMENVSYPPIVQAGIPAAASRIHENLTKDDDRTDDARALVQLGAHGSSLVAKDLAGGSPAVQLALVEALYHHYRPYPEAYGPALQQLAVQGNRTTRPVIIRTIVFAPQAKQIFAELVKSKDLNLELNAIDGYALTLDREAAVKILTPMLSEMNLDVQDSVAMVLLKDSILTVTQMQGQSGELAWPPSAPMVMRPPLAQLYKVLDSANTTNACKARAVFAIGEQGASAAAAVPRLTVIAADTHADPELRASAMTALGRMGSAATTALPALQSAVASSDRMIHDPASVAIERINKNAAAPAPPKEAVKISKRFQWRPQQKVVPANVIEHMQFLVQIINQYKLDHGTYPQSEGDLHPYFADAASERDAFINPRTGWNPGFWYLPPDMNAKPPVAASLLYESHGGQLVAFSDGSVRECNPKANPPVVRHTEANLLDLRDAVVIYQANHQQKFPQTLADLREAMPDEASWQRVITNPVTGESPGYVYVPPTAQSWDIVKLKQQVMVYQTVHGARYSSVPALYADLQVR